MAVDETLRLGLDLELTQLREKFAEVPGIGRKEARQLVSEIKREYRKAEKAAKKLGDKTGFEISRGMDKARDATERAAGLMGGVVGDVSDSVLDLGSKVGDLAGSIGGIGGAAVGVAGGVGVAAAAIGFATVATVEWMSTADELIERLEGVAGVSVLTPERRAELDAYQESMADLQAETDQLQLQLMSDLAPALIEVSHATLAVVGGFRELAEWTGGAEAAFERGRATATLFSWGLSELALTGLGGLASAGAEAAEETRQLTEAEIAARQASAEWDDAVKTTTEDLNAYAEALGYVRESYVDVDAAERERAEAARAAEAAARDAAAAAERQAAEYEQMWERAAAAEAARGAEAIRQAEKDAELQQQRLDDWDEQIQKIEESAEAAREIESAYTDWMIEQQRRRDESLDAMVEATLDTASQVAGVWTDLAVDQARATQDAHDAELSRLKTQRERIQAQVEAGELSKEQGRAALRRISDEEKAERAAKRRARKESEKAIMAGFVAQQAAAAARATIDAAANAVALTPAFVPIAGPAAPAAALAAAGLQLTAQLAAIASTSPPEFPYGGAVAKAFSGGMSPDHVAVGVRPDEGVVSPRGMRALGGPAGLDAVNRSSGPRDLMQSRPVIMIDSQVVGAAAVRSVRTHSGLARELDRRSGTHAGIRSL